MQCSRVLLGKSDPFKYYTKIEFVWKVMCLCLRVYLVTVSGWSVLYEYKEYSCMFT